MTRPSLAETLQTLLARAETPTKTAAVRVPAAARTETGDAVRKVAELLRAHQPAPMSLATFHVVKEAMVSGEFGPLPRPEYRAISENREAEGLRKVAAALRNQEIDERELDMLKAACALTAARAITLLKEYR